MKELPVLCCCNPNNHVGYLLEDSNDLKKGEYGNSIEGWELAFSSNHISLDKLKNIPGFREVKKKKRGRNKTWRERTWRS